MPGSRTGDGVEGGRTVGRPWQIYLLTALWAVKGFQEFFAGVIGAGFFASSQTARGVLSGYSLQLTIQSVLFSALLTIASFTVMTLLWFGKRPARTGGIAVALVSELPMLGYLISRPAEFGGDANLVRTVLVASIVNLGIVGMLLFDGRLAAFLGSTRLIGWWAPKR